MGLVFFIDIEWEIRFQRNGIVVSGEQNVFTGTVRAQNTFNGQTVFFADVGVAYLAANAFQHTAQLPGHFIGPLLVGRIAAGVDKILPHGEHVLPVGIDVTADGGQ